MLLPMITQAQGQRQRPPEYDRVRQALRIDDLSERIKALEAIKADFPETRYLDTIDMSILRARIGLSDSLSTILELQQELLSKQKGVGKLYMYYQNSMGLLTHDKLPQFDPKQVTRAVEEYTLQGGKLAKDPAFRNSIQERNRGSIDLIAPRLYLPMSKAFVHEKRAEKALEALTQYKALGGPDSKEYYYLKAQSYELQGNKQKTFDNYFQAAVERYEDSVEKARALYRQLQGSLEGFEEKLEAKQRELPYHPAPFRPVKTWRGKVVLAELFTGSECPPCAGADLGFDGLLEAYSSQYLAVLEYHVHIPRPDPLTNHATRERAKYYNCRSAPTTFFDGESKYGGGGDRSAGERKFGQYSGEINARIYAEPEVKLKLQAKLKGDAVEIFYAADKVLDNADFNLVLVQREQRFAGGNGILFHKMVVREFLTAPAEDKKATIDLSESENKAAAHLNDYEKENGFSFSEKPYQIDRSRLSVVFFVQDKQSKKVYNAVLVDVK
jgi:hypothetical protein